ncbi:hypothetical protein PRZ48_009619 [Zasmidium cellare]|uniref:F-box domain-containing protein n=1 Tax=Zasmidium cellare TaxID=395010 RepID=A0ABR0ECA5_ZASCE|nr:hypothetical protein PRZ48_009619 [Zasmidium cellare]
MVTTRSADALATIDDVPQELLDRVCNFCEIEALKSLRLTDKKFHSSATKALFKHVEVKPTTESCQKCLALMDSPALRLHPTTITFHTSLNPAHESQADTEETGLIRAKGGGYRHVQPFYDALSSVAKFEKLQHVGVYFAERCVSGEDWINEAPEDITVRSRVLRSLIEDTELPEKLHSLSIKNLQDLLPDVVFESEGWKKLLGKLDSLGIWVTNEGDEAAPERNLEYKQLHQFYATDLKTKILSPVRESLRELKLYGNEIYWGHYPHFDLKDPAMHFPKLETLALGKMAFVHDWQVEWIVRHASTLKALILDDCPIVIAGREYQQMDRPYVRRANSAPLQDYDICWTNPTRWHSLFRTFATSLPHLRHFALRSTPPSWHEQSQTQSVDSFTTPFALRNEMQVSRYRLFDMGIGPDQMVEVYHPQNYEKDWETQPGFEKLAVFDHSWMDELEEDEVDEELRVQLVEAMKFPACWDEDEAALKELMEAVEARR